MRKRMIVIKEIEKSEANTFNKMIDINGKEEIDFWKLMQRTKKGKWN